MKHFLYICLNKNRLNMKKLCFLCGVALLALTAVSCEKSLTDEDFGIAEWVDLGLSVKWCSHNDGANKPSDPGLTCSPSEWGNTVPSTEQWEELLNNCTLTRGHYNKGNGGIKGILFTSKKNQKTLFLPTTRNEFVGEYWTSTTIDDHTAYIFVFNLQAKGAIETAFNPFDYKESLGYRSCRRISTSY